MYKFHRDFYFLTEESILKNSVTFLLGTRKCGKTVCLKQLEDSLDNSVYVDFKQIADTESKYTVFDDILNDIKNNNPSVYLLDEITYVPNAEIKICEIANALSYTDNDQTKIVLTGSQSTALNAWSDRAFAGNAGKISVDFLTYSEFLRYKGITEISPDTYHQFLYGAADFYKFTSLEEYIKGCLEETIISNANATNYIFDNECDLIKDRTDILISICYQTLFTLHNHVNVQTFFKDNKLYDDVIAVFRETCKQIGNDVIADKIEKSFVGSYSYIKSQNLDVLKQAFLFLKKCDLITITPIARDLENIPDIYRDLFSEDSRVTRKDELFKKYNFTVKYPMFYVQILKDILGQNMPEKLPGIILGSIVECNARGLLPDGFEFHPFINENGNVIDAEIDYVNLQKGLATELTVSVKHKTCFELLPDYLQCILLTRNENTFENNIQKVDYCTYLYILSEEKYQAKDREYNFEEITDDLEKQGTGEDPGDATDDDLTL